MLFIRAIPASVPEDWDLKTEAGGGGPAYEKGASLADIPWAPFPGFERLSP